LHRILGVAFCVQFFAGCVPQAGPATPLPPTDAPSATPAPRTAATVVAASGDKEWDSIVIGDSSVAALVYRMPEILEKDNQDCLRQALQQFEADTDAIIAEIVSVCSPSDALIRTFDAHAYWAVAESKQKVVFEGLSKYWQAANEYLVKAAGEHGIPVARVNQALNGPNGDQDPMDNGYLIADHLHPSEKGWDAIAKLIRVKSARDAANCRSACSSSASIWPCVSPEHSACMYFPEPSRT